MGVQVILVVLVFALRAATKKRKRKRSSAFSEKKSAPPPAEKMLATPMVLNSIYHRSGEMLQSNSWLFLKMEISSN